MPASTNTPRMRRPSEPSSSPYAPVRSIADGGNDRRPREGEGSVGGGRTSTIAVISTRTPIVQILMHCPSPPFVLQQAGISSQRKPRSRSSASCASACPAPGTASPANSSNHTRPGGNRKLAVRANARAARGGSVAYGTWRARCARG